MTRRTCWLLAALAALALALAGCDRTAPPGEVTLAAAASLRGVLPELVRAYQARHPTARVAVTYGASGSLKQQVEGGAPIDAVIFAGARQVDELAAAGHVDPASRRVLASNVLVLIGPRPPSGKPSVQDGGSAPTLLRARPLTFATLDTLPPGERVAIGDPGSVPAGEYARAWLTSLGTWDALQGRLVLGGDVAAVLTYARRGEVAAAIVYRTEVRGVDDVVILDEARGPLAPRPEVVGAVVTRHDGGHPQTPGRGPTDPGRSAAEAGAFLGFVAAPEGQRILADFGFGPP